MNEALTESTKDKFISGRYGLNIPSVESRFPRDNQLNNFDVLHFFHRLWEANGYSLDTARRGRNSEKPYNHELVVPGDANKQLVILRGTYTPTDETERMREELNAPGYDSRVTYGYETHEVLAPPSKLGNFQTLVKVKYFHRYGSHSGGMINYPSVFGYGKYLVEHDFRPKEFSGNLEADMNTTAQAWSEATRQLLTQTVELLI